MGSRRKKTLPKKFAESLRPMEEKYVKRFLNSLDRIYKDAHCSLDFKNPLQLLVATILSAQCTDKRVNIVTSSLFKKYKLSRDYAAAPIEKLEEAIRSTGFFRNKAKSIRGACTMIEEDFGGAVPDTMGSLLTLPGVARKTASVVLGNAFEITDGIVVDTHVARLSQRLGLSANTRADKIERDLMKIVPRKKWILFSHQIIQHGRKICKARKPDCPSCPFAELCPSPDRLDIKAAATRRFKSEKNKKSRDS